MSITIRVATTKDIEAIHHIIKIGFSHYASLANANAAAPALSETPADIAADIKSKHVLLALEDGRPVGTARIAFYGDTAYLSRFAVLQQGIGIGTALMDYAAQYAAEKGARTLNLHTAASAAPTISFYENCGFSTLSETVWHGYRRLYMGKTLNYE